jgi:hypothetical protein
MQISGEPQKETPKTPAKGLPASIWVPAFIAAAIGLVAIFAMV